MAGDDRTFGCWTGASFGAQPSVVCGGGIPLGGTPVDWTTLQAFGPHPISEADVERIAKRVVELLKASP